MNGLLKLALIGGGLYFAYRLWEKGGAVTGLSVSVKGIKYGGSDLSKTRFEVDLGIVNPSGESFSFTRFFGQLRFNGQLLATVQKEGAGSGITVKPAGETVLTVPVYINHLSTLTSLKTILEKIIAHQPITGVEFNGMLYVGGYGIPINQTVSLNFTGGVSGVSNCFTCARPSLGGVLN